MAITEPPDGEPGGGDDQYSGGGGESNEFKSNQRESNELKSNQSESNELKSNQSESNELKRNQNESNLLKSNQSEENQFRSNQNNRSINQIQPMSYSDRLKTNVRFDQRLKRNILEITLEKTNRDSDMDVGQEDIVRVFQTLGIDIVSQVQGYQVQYKGRSSVISVWMAPGINLERFCKDVNIRVKEGVMTGMIRPAGKLAVRVSVIGLDFNTPDTFVFDYLSKFGNVTNKTVVYSKFEIGPFKGKFNGERKYEVDFSKASRHMGTYHIIDGSKVRIFYRGNKKTCGRCHKTAEECPGKSIARDCDSNGGDRTHLSDHMKKLWAEVGFVPTNFELNEEDTSAEPDQQNTATSAPVKIATNFPPMVRPEPTSRDIEHYNGITVKNLPSTLDDKEIFKFLLNYGVPHDHELEQIRINKGKKNTWVFIDNLSSESVQTIFSSLHFPVTKQKFHDVPIYCNPVRNMTPRKSPDAENVPPNSIETIASANNPSTETPTVPEPTTSSDSSSLANKDKVACKESITSPSSEGFIPGISRSEQKKALKKVKEKKLAAEKKKELEKQKEEKKKIDQQKKNIELVRKDFMKTKDLDSSVNLEDVFFFEDSDPNQLSTPFSTSLMESLTPRPFGSFSAKQIQKEELWRNSVQTHEQKNKKRVMTPENEERKTRFKEGKGGKQL